MSVNCLRCLSWEVDGREGICHLLPVLKAVRIQPVLYRSLYYRLANNSVKLMLMHSPGCSGPSGEAAPSTVEGAYIDIGGRGSYENSALVHFYLSEYICLKNTKIYLFICLL